MKPILILLLATVTMASAQRPNNDTTLLRNLSHEKFLWLADKDTAQLRTLLDDSVQYIHSNGWVETKAEVLQDLTSGKLTYHSVVVVADTATIMDVKGIVTGTGLFNVTVNEKTVEMTLWYTEVYIRQKGLWKLVYRNAKRV